MCKSTPLAFLMLAIATSGFASVSPHVLRFSEPAPLSEDGWTRYSLPLGNGFIGANVFGGQREDRIVIAEKTVVDARQVLPPSTIGHERFSLLDALHLDFSFGSMHPAMLLSNYERTLNLEEARAHVDFDGDGVYWTREYVTSYPDRVLAMRFTASEKGRLAFTVRPKIPYPQPFREHGGPGFLGVEGTVVAMGNIVKVDYLTETFRVRFAGRIGAESDGEILAAGDALTVTNATEATLYFVCETNYRLSSEVFAKSLREKLAGEPDPAPRVDARLAAVMKKGYAAILADHLRDVRRNFCTASLDLDPAPEDAKLSTDALVAACRRGRTSRLLDETYWQFGRYLLFSSSRPGSLPANLQGAWNGYRIPGWGGGYWHNVNVQMNYWPAFSCNLAECFRSYAEYAAAYRPAARRYAEEYVREVNPAGLGFGPLGSDAWTIGCPAFPYGIVKASPHSGPGMSGFTTKMFVDWWDFTRDETALREYCWPMIHGAADFLTRVVIQTNGLYLCARSASPEQLGPKGCIATVGCSFDQQMIHENNSDCLKLAAHLGIDDAVTRRVREQLGHYDPMPIGASGQIKEFREEDEYGEFGEKEHRHMSQLMCLMPGAAVTRETPELVEAAKKTLAYRGDGHHWLIPGWATAQRIACWARCFDAEHAYRILETEHFGNRKRTNENLWDGPSFQIDGNLGGTAAITEMLIQSHAGYIDLLPALPKAWARRGSFRGLCARGGFTVDCRWENGVPVDVKVWSKTGSAADVRFAGRKTPFVLKNKEAGANLRQRVSLNEGWASDLVPEGGAPRHLENVTLPHSWLDYQGMRRLVHGNVHGTATYRREIEWRPASPTLRANLVFEGVGQYLTLRVNGTAVCTHRPAGRLVTTLDVTDFLREGANAIEAVCEHPSDDLDLPWVCGGCGPQGCEGPEPLGLFRNVSLEVTDEVRIAPFGVQIVYDPALANAEARIEVENRSGTARQIAVCVEQPELGVRAGGEVRLEPDASGICTVAFPLGNVSRWSPKSPKLYAFTTTLSTGGRVVDSVGTKTGFRTIAWPKSQPSSGRVFMLNGEPFFIHGTAETDHRFGGSMAFDRREIDARCDEVEKLGFNAFRDGHEPHDLRYSERWDADGVLWWPQLSTHNFQDTAAWKSNFTWAVREWVKERRNSPSVILWGLQNESIIDEDFAAEMTRLVHALDPLSGRKCGRLVTTCNGGLGADWDIVQNWSGTYAGRFGRLEDYSEALKRDDQLLNGEYGAWRIVGFHGPEDAPYVFGAPPTEENAARILMEKLKGAWKVKDAVCGQFLWTLFTHENPGRTHCEGGYRMIDKFGPVNNKGLLAINGERTAAWYAYRAFGQRLKDGTVGEIVEKPLSAWLAEGRSLEEGPLLPTPSFDVPTNRTCVFRLNCGGDAFTDSRGNVWQGDVAGVYSHSWSADADLQIEGFALDPVLGSQGEIALPVKNVHAHDAELFRTYRYGRHRLSFTLPAPQDADCWVEAFFVEPGSYGRIFDVALNGVRVEDDFNLGKVPARNVVRKIWRAHADMDGVVTLSFPEVAVNEAVISAIEVYVDAGKSWKEHDAQVSASIPKAMMPKGPAAKLFPIRAQLPPPPDRDGYKCGWFGPHYANDFSVVFKVKSGNPIGKTIAWKLVHDTTHEEFRSGTYRVESLSEDGKVVLPLGFQVNAGWYNVMYKTEGCELTAVEMR